MKMSRREILGFGLLGTVVIIWVISGFFIQNLFSSKYDHPVAMTIFSVSLCSLLLLLPSSSTDEPKMGRSQVVALGLVWLGGQLSYNTSLKYMSVSSSTAVSSMSSIFTFAFSMLLLSGYKATWHALAALSLSTAGIFIIASQQPGGNGVQERLVGFFIAGASCAFYGLFTTLLKKWQQREDQLFIPLIGKTKREGLSVVTLFGWFGVVAFLAGIPLVWLANATGFDLFALPDLAAVVGMTLNALIGSVLSDVLLAQAVLFLNPITVSIGLSLTMPLSMFIDSVVLNAHTFKPVYALGNVLQFASIYCISVDNHRERHM